MNVAIDSWTQIAWTQLWQLSVLIVAVWVTVRLAARNRPHLASALWLVVLMKCVTPPLWSSPCGVFSWLQRGPAVAQSRSLDAPQLIASPAAALDPVKSTSQELAVELSPTDSVPGPAIESGSIPVDVSVTSPPVVVPAVWGISFWFGLLWLVGSLGFAVVASLRWFFCLWRLRRAGVIDGTEVNQLAERLRQRLGLRRAVRVVVSRSPVGPAVVGIIRPTVILPALIVQAKSLPELEPLLAHELIHIRRGDLWIGLWQLLAQAVWWFHPLVRLANNLLTREAERCCDEEVIARLGCDPAQYARSLVDVLALKRTLQPVPAFPGVRPVDVTSQRLERIMKLGQGCHKRTPRWCWLVMLFVAAITIPGAAFIVAGEESQPAAEPAVKQIGAIELSRDTSPMPLVSGEGGKCAYPVQDILEQIMQHESVSDQLARVILIRRATEAATPAPKTPYVVSSPGVAKILPQATVAPVITCIGDSLQVISSDDVQTRVVRELQRLREDGLEKISIDTRIITGPVANLKALLKHAERSKVLYLGSPVSELDVDVDELRTNDIERTRDVLTNPIQGRVETVVRSHPTVLLSLADLFVMESIACAVKADDKNRLSFVPRITVYNGQVAQIRKGMQRPFVRSISSTAPVIQHVEEGWSLYCLPKLEKQGDVIRLDLHLTTSRVKNVDSVNVPAGQKQDTPRLQSPEVEITRVRSTVEVLQNQTLIVAGLNAISLKDQPAEPFLVLIDVQRTGSGSTVRGASNISSTQYTAGPGPDTPATPSAENTNTTLSSEGPAVAPPAIDPPLDTRAYNVRDLVETFLQEPVLTLSETGQKVAPERLIKEQNNLAPLVDLIIKTVDPNSWDENGGAARIRPYAETSTLVVRQTAEGHRQLADVLQQLRNPHRHQLTLDFDRLEISNTEFEAWLKTKKSRSSIDLSVFLTERYSRTRAISATMEEALRQADGVKFHGGPSINLINGQRLDLQLPTVGDQSEPAVTRLHILPILTSDLRTVCLDVSAFQHSIGKRMPYNSIPVAMSVDASLLVPISQDVWMGRSPENGNEANQPKRASRLFYLVKAKRLPPSK